MTSGRYDRWRFKKMPNCFSDLLHYFAFPPTINKWSNFFASSPVFDVDKVSSFTHSDRCVVISHCGLIYIYISLMGNEIEHISMYLFAICTFLFSEISVYVCGPFSSCIVPFYLSIYLSIYTHTHIIYICLLYTSLCPLLEMWFTSTFS